LLGGLGLLEHRWIAELHVEFEQAVNQAPLTDTSQSQPRRLHHIGFLCPFARLALTILPRRGGLDAAV